MEQVTLDSDHKKMYDRVSAMAKIGVWECDLATDELTWADAVYDLYDMPRGSKVERAATMACYEPASRRELEVLRSEAINNGTGFKLDISIRTAKGNRRWIRLTADVEQEQGKSVRIFGTKQDISEERFAQDKVNALQSELIHLARLNAMNAMASTLAHEINQPLTAVVSYIAAANRLAAPETAPPELLECTNGALESAMRAGDIIRRLREMSGGGSVAKEDLDLSQVVNEALALVTAGNASVAVTCELDANVSVRGDRIQFQQVFVNLIRNSLEAAGDNPCRLEIHALQKQGRLTVCVNDDGPGMSADILPSIFESHATTKPGGLGIGLSICRTIIESHGGAITASNRPQGGASLCFTLPSSEYERP